MAEFEDDLLPEIVQGTNLFEHRETLVERTDTRGEIIMNFMAENEFILLNERTKPDTPGKFSSSKASTTFDLVWVNTDQARNVKDLEISSALLGSNHLPVTLKLELLCARKWTPVGILHSSPCPRGVDTDAPQRTTLKWKQDKAIDYSRRLATLSSTLNVSSLDDVDFLNERITSSMRIAASEGWKPLLDVIQIDTWSEFLIQTYPPRLLRELPYPDNSNHPMNARISLEELNKSIKNTKSGKARGEDQLSASFFKFLPIGLEVPPLVTV